MSQTVLGEAKSLELRAIPSRVIEEARLTRQVAASENLYSVLKARYEEVSLQEAQTAPDLSVLDFAVPPTHPNANDAPKLFLLAIFASKAVHGVHVQKWLGDPKLPRYPGSLRLDAVGNCFNQLWRCRVIRHRTHHADRRRHVHKPKQLIQPAIRDHGVVIEQDDIVTADFGDRFLRRLAAVAQPRMDIGTPGWSGTCLLGCWRSLTF